MQQKRYFITAIGTDSGKTLISALLCEALQADYWKPIQAGNPTDLSTVKSLVSNPKTQFFPSTYALQKPASPHDSAQAEGLQIELSKIQIPQTENALIIEGAGGLLVPLNEKDFVIDMVDNWQDSNVEIILVANLYLGSINHTLLSIKELERRNLKVKGIIFNGNSNPESEQIIAKHCPFPILFHLPFLDKPNQSTVAFWAKAMQFLGE